MAMLFLSSSLASRESSTRKSLSRVWKYLDWDQPSFILREPESFLFVESSGLGLPLLITNALDFQRRALLDFGPIDEVVAIERLSNVTSRTGYQRFLARDGSAISACSGPPSRISIIQRDGCHNVTNDTQSSHFQHIDFVSYGRICRRRRRRISNGRGA